jgi:hypothetical protein
MRFMTTACMAIAILVTASFTPVARGAEGKPVGVVSRINLVSDRSQDIATLDAWRKTYIKDGMSDQEKAIAIFDTVVRYRHQANPPREYLSSAEAGGHVHDPLKSFHVYGYGQCCCASAEVIGLAQYLGLKARGRDISRHSVPEVFCDGRWGLVDASVMNYHVKNDGTLANVDEIHQSVAEWSKEHPDLANDDKKLRPFAKNGGWKNGPPLLAKAERFYGKHGVNSAGWHGWSSTMQEYFEVQPEPHDFCVTMGYQLNVQLRPGERLTRNFFSRGIGYTNKASPKYYAELLDRKLLGIQTEMGDRAPGRIGDGTVEWNVPLDLAQLRASALAVENLAAAGNRVGVDDPSKPGLLVLRFPSSYVYVKGQAVLDIARGAGGGITVSFSDNNGLDWKEVRKLEQGGGQTLDLTPLVQKRYDYWLKFELTGKGTSLNALNTANHFQCSQAALPALSEGENQLAFSAGPQEGTVTIEGATDTETATKNEQLTVASFHPVLSGAMTEKLQMNGATGDATFNVATPGDMTALRISAVWRARGAKDGFDVQASYDGGRTFSTIGNGHLQGGTKGESRYLIVKDVPPGTRAAQVRLAGKQADTALMFDWRIDADYAEPTGAFKPVRITYVWDEDGHPKSHVHVAKSPSETYAITCGPKTVVKSFAMELAE